MGSILILRTLNALDNVQHQMPELVTAEDLPGNTVSIAHYTTKILIILPFPHP